MRLTVGMCPALTEDVMEKLKQHGINNIREFMKTDPEVIAMQASISYRDLRSIRRVITAHSAAFVVKGDDLLREAIITTRPIPTGNPELDELLGGGVLTGEVLEVCGGWGTGKTTLCINWAIHAALTLGLSVLYIDPMASVNTLRLIPIIEALSTKSEEVEAALSRIKVVYPTDVWKVLEYLDMVQQPYLSIRKYTSPSCGGSGVNPSNPCAKIKLVILDSLSSIVTPLFIGSTRQELGILNQLGVSLKRLANEQSVAVVVVNSVVKIDHNKRSKIQAKKWKPALGKFWESVPHTRLFIEQSDSNRVGKSNSNIGQTGNVSPVCVSVWKSTRLKLSESKLSLFSVPDT